MIIIFCAPSGSGKSTMVKHLLNRYPDTFELSISCTTRAPRGEEQNGREYYFITQQEFENKIEEGLFVEYEQVYEGLYYGTLRSEIDRIQSNGHTIIFDIDVKGGLNLKRLFGNKALSIFICPPCIEVLNERLHGRGDTSEEMIQRRVAKAAKEMEYAPYFDIRIINDNLNKAKNELENIIENNVLTSNS